MKIQPPPGMRDFYPDDLRVQNWLFDAWRSVSRSFGFSEYEGPIFEFLDLYTLKSGAGIVSELFNFRDRGDRAFAIRPEMTPTLARMVAAKASALPRPIKWFSIPRLCRAEKPQRGRLREFFQWNVDTLGQDDMLADAEVIAALAEFYRKVGVTPAEVVVRISSRSLAAAVLAGVGLTAGDADRAFTLIDKYDPTNPDEFRRRWREGEGALGNVVDVERVESLFSAPLDECAALAAQHGEVGAAAGTQLNELMRLLESFGVTDYCRFDLTIVRGLAYYTGPVFEASARTVGLRALAGGGRYDNLCQLLDGPRVTGVGFGMGDAPNTEFLREIGKLPTPGERIQIFVIDADEAQFPAAIEIVSRLRRAGLTTDFSYKRQALGKQLKSASARGAEFVVIVGSEYATARELAVKSMDSGQQKTFPAAALLAEPATGLEQIRAALAK